MAEAKGKEDKENKSEVLLKRIKINFEEGPFVGLQISCMYDADPGSGARLRIKIAVEDIRRIDTIKALIADLHNFFGIVPVSGSLRAISDTEISFVLNDRGDVAKFFSFLAENGISKSDKEMLTALKVGQSSAGPVAVRSILPNFEAVMFQTLEHLCDKYFRLVGGEAPPEGPKRDRHTSNFHIAQAIEHYKKDTDYLGLLNFICQELNKAKPAPRSFFSRSLLPNEYTGDHVTALEEIIKKFTAYNKKYEEITRRILVGHDGVYTEDATKLIESLEGHSKGCESMLTKLAPMFRKPGEAYNHLAHGIKLDEVQRTHLQLFMEVFYRVAKIKAKIAPKGLYQASLPFMGNLKVLLRNLLAIRSLPVELIPAYILLRTGQGMAEWLATAQISKNEYDHATNDQEREKARKKIEEMSRIVEELIGNIQREILRKKIVHDQIIPGWNITVRGAIADLEACQRMLDLKPKLPERKLERKKEAKAAIKPPLAARAASVAIAPAPLEQKEAKIAAQPTPAAPAAQVDAPVALPPQKPPEQEEEGEETEIEPWECPISGETMRDPWILEDGVTYEREAIIEWLKARKEKEGNNYFSVCPRGNKIEVDEQGIPKRGFYANKELQILIRECKSHAQQPLLEREGVKLYRNPWMWRGVTYEKADALAQLEKEGISVDASQHEFFENTALRDMALFIVIIEKINAKRNEINMVAKDQLEVAVAPQEQKQPTAQQIIANNFLKDAASLNKQPEVKKDAPVQEDKQKAKPTPSFTCLITKKPITEPYINGGGNSVDKAGVDSGYLSRCIPNHHLKKLITGGFEDVEESCRCPKSQQIMADPVVIQTGHTLERSVAEQWFKDGNLTCPITGVALTKAQCSVLIPNRALKTWIEQNKQQQQEQVGQVSAAPQRSRN